jgi:hypothetical protein
MLRQEKSGNPAEIPFFLGASFKKIFQIVVPAVSTICRKSAN